MPPDRRPIRSPAQPGQAEERGCTCPAPAGSGGQPLSPLARGCSLQYRRDAARRHQRYPLLETDADLDSLLAQVRTETRPYLRTEVRSKLAALREQLPEEDRETLLLRVDRGLEWRGLARVLHEGEAPSGESLAREAQQLRRRFQLLKERLRQLGREAGLPSTPFMGHLSWLVRP